MSRKGFLVDLNLCVSCKACEVACKTWNGVPTQKNIRWRRVVDQEFGLYPHADGQSVSMSCNHCAEPACVSACPTGAMHVRGADGTVLLDRDRCIGCQYCKSVCPYGAPQFDAEARKTSKCTFCADRQDAGLGPACVDTCVTEALKWGDLDEIDRMGVDRIEGFADPKYTSPSIRFILRRG